MVVRPALGGNQVRRVSRHAGARTDVAARLEIGDEQGFLRTGCSAPLVADSGAHENARDKRALPTQRCRLYAG